MPIDKFLLSQFVDLTLEKRAVKKRERELNASLTSLQEEILQQFEEEEILESVRVKGYNIKPKRTLWAAPIGGDYERACKALEESGHGEYVNTRFDSRSVSALVREYDGQEEGIPGDLAENLKISEVFTLSVTKGAK